MAVRIKPKLADGQKVSAGRLSTPTVTSKKTGKGGLASMSDATRMRLNAAKGSQSQEQKKVERKAKIKGALKKAAPFAGMAAMGALTGVGAKMSNAAMRRKGTL